MELEAHTPAQVLGFKKALGIVSGSEWKYVSIFRGAGKCLNTGYMVQLIEGPEYLNL